VRLKYWRLVSVQKILGENNFALLIFELLHTHTALVHSTGKAQNSHFKINFNIKFLDGSLGGSWLKWRFNRLNFHDVSHCVWRSLLGLLTLVLLIWAVITSINHQTHKAHTRLNLKITELGLKRLSVSFMTKIAASHLFILDVVVVLLRRVVWRVCKLLVWCELMIRVGDVNAEASRVSAVSWTEFRYLSRSY